MENRHKVLWRFLVQGSGGIADLPRDVTTQSGSEYQRLRSIVEPDRDLLNAEIGVFDALDSSALDPVWATAVITRRLNTGEVVFSPYLLQEVPGGDVREEIIPIPDKDHRPPVGTVKGYDSCLGEVRKPTGDDLPGGRQSSFVKHTDHYLSVYVRIEFLTTGF